MRVQLKVTATAQVSDSTNLLQRNAPVTFFKSSALTTSTVINVTNASSIDIDGLANFGSLINVATDTHQTILHAKAIPTRSFLLAIPSTILAVITGQIYIVPTAQYAINRSTLELITRLTASVGLNIALAFYCCMETGRILLFGNIDLSTADGKQAYRQITQDNPNIIIRTFKTASKQIFILLIAGLSSVPQVSLQQGQGKYPNNLPKIIIALLKLMPKLPLAIAVGLSQTFQNALGIEALLFNPHPVFRPLLWLLNWPKQTLLNRYNNPFEIQYRKINEKLLRIKQASQQTYSNAIQEILNLMRSRNRDQVTILLELVAAMQGIDDVNTTINLLYMAASFGSPNRSKTKNTLVDYISEAQLWCLMLFMVYLQNFSLLGYERDTTRDAENYIDNDLLAQCLGILIFIPFSGLLTAFAGTVGANVHWLLTEFKRNYFKSSSTIRFLFDGIINLVNRNAGRPFIIPNVDMAQMFLPLAIINILAYGLGLYSDSTSQLLTQEYYPAWLAKSLLVVWQIRIGTMIGNAYPVSSLAAAISRIFHRILGGERTQQELYLVEFIENYIKILKTIDPYQHLRTAYDLIQQQKQNPGQFTKPQLEDFIKVFYFGKAEHPKVIFPEENFKTFVEMVESIMAEIIDHNAEVQEKYPAHCCSRFFRPPTFKLSNEDELRSSPINDFGYA